MGLLSHDNKPHYKYVVEPPSLYISHASPEQIKQDQYQEKLETTGDIDQIIKR